MSEPLNFAGLVLFPDDLCKVSVVNSDCVVVAYRDGEQDIFEDCDWPQICAAIRAWAAGLNKPKQAPVAELMPIWHSIYDLYNKIAGSAPAQEPEDDEPTEEMMETGLNTWFNTPGGSREGLKAAYKAMRDARKAALQKEVNHG